jgi:hypothetical protein
MTRTSRLRPHFVPFAKTIDALNRVSRAIQDERVRAAQAEQQLQAMGGMSSAGEVGIEQQLPLPSAVFDMSAFQGLASRPLSGGAAHGAGGAEGELDPLGFVRALESDFMARNWHEDWWEMDDGGLGGGG